jgi:hypothetical protein
MNDSLHSVLSLVAFVIEEAHHRGFSSLSAAIPPLLSADSVVSSISTATTDNLALAHGACFANHRAATGFSRIFGFSCSFFKIKQTSAERDSSIERSNFNQDRVRRPSNSISENCLAF